MRYSEEALKQLSDDDLVALDSGNLEALSDKGLQILDRDRMLQKPLSRMEKAVGLVGQVGQGAGFNLIDEAAAAVSTPVVAAMQGRSDFGNIYQENAKIGRDLFARTQRQIPLGSLAANIAGGAKTAVGFVGGARDAMGAAGRLGAVGSAYAAGDAEGDTTGQSIFNRAAEGVKAFFPSAALGYAGGKVLDRIMPDARMTPEGLKTAYKGAKNQLKEVKLDKKQLGELANTINSEVGGSVFSVTGREIPAAIQDINNLARRGATAYQLDELRSQLPAQPLGYRMKEIMDNFTEGQGIPAEFRDTYRRAMTAQNLQKAIDTGGDSVTQMRTRIRTMSQKAKGLSEAEQAALKKAGNIGVAESALRVGKLPAAILSGFTGAGFDPRVGAGVFLGGKVLDASADAIAKKRAQEALETILSGGKKGLTYNERFGALIKRK